MKSISYEQAAAFGDPVAFGEEKIPTSEGIKTVPEIMDCLMWGSYAANRDGGMSHEQLAKWGIGNEAMRNRYACAAKLDFTAINTDTFLGLCFVNAYGKDRLEAIKEIREAYNDNPGMVNGIIGTENMKQIL